MGCDIHCHVEVKFNDQWHHYTFLKIPRYYGLFAKMANVRNYDNEVKPIAKPRGLPQDITEMSKFVFKQWEDDAHSSSYLTSKEVVDLFDWITTEESIIDAKAIRIKRG